jgi:hypothetical protein
MESVETIVVVGNGAEMRIRTGEMVTLAVAGPLVAAHEVLAAPAAPCGWRCIHSTSMYREANPDETRRPSSEETASSQMAVEAGWVVRFHNAVLARITGSAGTELDFWIPDEERVSIELR